MSEYTEFPPLSAEDEAKYGPDGVSVPKQALDDLTEQHLQRIKQGTIHKLGRKDIAEWIEKHTYIGGRKFSFAGHEYQQKILTDPSPEIAIRKSAQTGISEMALRMAAALMALMPPKFAIGYTFPTAGFAAQYSRTRFDPIVTTSKTLKASMSEGTLDNAEVKSFAGERFVYFKGAAVGNAAISTSLDMLIHDEVDFSDADILGDYTSRMIHSPYKWRMRLSTPTFPGGPIDKAFQASRRHFLFCTCNHCGHRFLPWYYDHVKIPGYDKDLKEIKADNLHSIRWEEAKLLCPKCFKEPSLLPMHREWVIENPGEKHVTSGIQVSPHDAPTVVTVPDLVKASTTYATSAKFQQFSLGRPAADADSGLTEDDVNAMGVEMVQSPFSTHVMGVDLGQTCHFMVGGLDNRAGLGVVHYERCAVGDFRATYSRLAQRYRVTIKVSDSQPYLETILNMQQLDPNLYGAYYVRKSGLELYDVKVRDEEGTEAKTALRQVSINRNPVFDKLMDEIRSKRVWMAKIGLEWALILAHLTDMRRATGIVHNGELVTNWVKSTLGQDHYHHTLLYLWIAAQMRGLASGGIDIASLGVSTFKVKDHTAPVPRGHH